MLESATCYCSLERSKRSGRVPDEQTVPSRDPLMAEQPTPQSTPQPSGDPQPTPPSGDLPLYRRLIQGTVRRLTLILSLVALVASLTWIGWAWRGKPEIHSPGPVALPHARLDCSDCHVTP